MVTALYFIIIFPGVFLSGVLLQGTAASVLQSHSCNH